MARHDCICPDTSPCKDKATRREMERNKECPHTTPPIEREDFEHGRMRPLSYSAAEVSKAIVRNVERIGSDDMTLIQKRAFADLKRFGIWNIAQPDNMVDFRNWFGLIDDLFFGGLLKGFCRIEVVDEKEMISRTGKSRMGYSKIITPGSKSDPKHKLKAPYCLIVLRKLSKNPLDNIGSYISTLCHEMVHSMLQLYTCAFSRCRNEIERWGHGSRWQAPALAIEKAFASEAVLGWKIKVGRETGMAHDIREGEPMEGAEALQGLEIDFEKVKSTVKRLKKREEKRKASGIDKPPKSNG